MGSPINQRQSARLAKDLKKRGFKFVGPVVTHLFMLAGGLIQLIDEK
ncbi:DNA-3-methyladenine glycosylase I [Latilactobacillus sakei]